MPRSAKLRKKGKFWYTDAGGASGKYFGRIDQVTHAQARTLFADHLASIASQKPTGAHSVAVLIDEFLTLLQEHRSGRTYSERKLHLERFANHRRGTSIVGDLKATSVGVEDLQSFLQTAGKKLELDPFTLHKHAVSIIACFNWGAGAARLKNPRPSLPPGFRPFAQFERYKIPPNELHEDELPTPDEVESILKWADADIEQVFEKGRYRSRRQEERRTADDNPYIGFQDILRVFYGTGARTNELAACSVRDCIHGSKQIVLGTHKRSKTLREAATRRITLNKESYAIVARRCKGKKPDDPIFVDAQGNRWSSNSLDVRFARIRKLAGVRSEISIYSFRHLWISQSLMAGVDIHTVAKMAGTSVAMIERVYGHYSSSHMTQAQELLDQARSKLTGAA